MLLAAQEHRRPGSEPYDIDLCRWDTKPAKISRRTVAPLRFWWLVARLDTAAEAFLGRLPYDQGSYDQGSYDQGR